MQRDLSINRTHDFKDLDRDTFHILMVGLISVGGLLLLAEGVLRDLFPLTILAGKQIPFLSLLFVLLAMVLYMLSARLHLNHIAGLLIGALGLMAASVAWLTGNGATWPLILAAPLMALVYLPGRQSLLFVLATLAVLALLPGRALFPPLEPVLGGSLAVLLTLVWGAGRVEERRRESVYHSYAGYLDEAQRKVEDARNDRQQLRQVSQDLAQAYLHLRQLYKLLRESQLDVEIAQRTKEEFVANVSHELRTPLNMIIGFSEMMMKSPQLYGRDLPGTLMADIHVIYRNSRHLSDLIDDILSFSQTELGRMNLSRSWSDLGAIVDDAMQVVMPLFVSKGLALCAITPEQLPPVFCDRLRVRQVMLNLLSNAGRHTTSGDVTIDVVQRKQSVVIHVRDTGPGIPAQELTQIFQPFYRSGQAGQPQEQGTGLGLSISRQLVEQHGGEMWVESEVGMGTCFSFSLPLDLDGDEPPSTRWIHPYSPYDGTERRPLPVLADYRERIVVFERHRTLSPHVERLLDDVEVVQVESMAELETVCREQIPRVVLINDADIMENRMRRPRLPELPHRTPVISCYLPSRIDALHTLNVVEYLIKPLARDTLMSTIGRVLPAGGTVLIVEDQPDAARLMRRQLTGAPTPYRVLHARDGETALQILRRRVPDLVLLDLNLPDTDGYDVLREKHGDAAIADIPTIIISARDHLGGPVVAGRVRVELVGGLSTRDIMLCTGAISQALAAGKQPAGQAPPETPAAQPVSE